MIGSKYSSMQYGVTFNPDVGYTIYQSLLCSRCYSQVYGGNQNISDCNTTIGQI